MSIKKRVEDLEKALDIHPSTIPKAEKIQVLRRGESMEERREAVIARYGSARGVTFARIKGRDD
jgi:hypothetical protein